MLDIPMEEQKLQNILVTLQIFNFLQNLVNCQQVSVLEDFLMITDK